MPKLLKSALLLGALINLTLAATGCGDSEDRLVVNASEAAFVPVVESSDVFVGVPRLVLTLVEQDRQPQFADGARFLIRYFEPTEGGVKFHSEADLQSIDVEGFRYLVAAVVPFDSPGAWAIAVTVELPDGRAESTPRLAFLVEERPRGPRPGDPAPAVRTPTAADGVVKRMAPPPEASLGLYDRSASDLLAAGEPFLIVWASAERCAGRRACAWALDQAATVLNQGQIPVLHLEPFGRPRQGELQALINAANEAWSIEAEPQFFVVDSTGVISAHFEIVVDDAELQQAIATVVP